MLKENIQTIRKPLHPTAITPSRRFRIMPMLGSAGLVLGIAQATADPPAIASAAVNAPTEAVKPQATVESPARHARAARAHPAGNPLEQRIALLAKELDLDATQQAKVKALLESQRDQVSKIWGDTAVPAGYRVIATQAISDKTAGQIRALLNDAQRKKYLAEKPPRVEMDNASKPGVEAWMYPGSTK
jgi:hypothetical protein